MSNEVAAVPPGDKTPRVSYGASESAKLPGQYEEQFVLADSQQEAWFVDGRLNDYEARQVKRERLKTILARGVVPEVAMPDTRRAIDVAVWQHQEEQRRKKWLEEHPPETETVVVEPTNLDLEADGVEVKLVGPNGYIKVNGQQMNGVQSMTIQLEAARPPRVTMEVVTSNPPKSPTG